MRTYLGLLTNAVRSALRSKHDLMLENLALRQRYVESFNGKLRDECLNLERFDTLLEARVLVERWR